MERFDLIVIGAGASGLAAAIEAARTHDGLNVAVLERLPRAGKKILATGNGRCNLSNLYAAEHNYTNRAFAATSLEEFDVNSTLAFFESMGMLTHTDSEGRIYPLSNTAASVLDALRFEAKRLGINIICDTQVKSIKKLNSCFELDGKYSCDFLIVAAGGSAAAVHGTDGSGVELLRSLGHTATALHPSLVQLKSSSTFLRPLKGLRSAAALSLYYGEKLVAGTSGEILFTDYGVSGIAAMDLSRSLISGGQNRLVIDLLPSVSSEKAASVLQKRAANNPSLPIEELCGGLMHKRIAQGICKAVLPYKLNEPVSALTENDILAIIKFAKTVSLDISGTNGFDDAQVTHGGAAVSEFDAATMRSRKVNRLYACGEVLDVDGGCGGFNLQWAWSSGRLAGRLNK